jgi:hypothetical protein
MHVSPVVRRAWTWGGGAAAAVLLVLGGANALGVVAHEAETVVTRVRGPGISTVEVRSPGTVRVTSGSRGAIAVTAHLVRGLRGPDHGHRLEGRRLVVWADCPAVFGGRCSARFTLKVAQGINVVAHADHGDVEVTDTFGSVEAVSEHGDVTAVNVVGSAHLETEHGEVRGEGLNAESVRAVSEHGDVRLVMSGAPRDVAAETEHGDVEVVLPDDGLAYRVDAGSEHGTTRTDVRVDPSSPRAVTARSEHGDVVVRYGGFSLLPVPTA